MSLTVDSVSKQFGRATHGVALSTDGHVYVADRPNHRIQAFTFAGKFVGEVFTDRRARGIDDLDQRCVPWPELWADGRPSLSTTLIRQ